jgi:hypothetical protein
MTRLTFLEGGKLGSNHQPNTAETSILSTTSTTKMAQIPQNLPDLVRERFDAARASGAISFWPTEVDILQVNGIAVIAPPPANVPKAQDHGSSAIQPTEG